jgi:hypothetical protein
MGAGAREILGLYASEEDAKDAKDELVERFSMDGSDDIGIAEVRMFGYANYRGVAYLLVPVSEEGELQVWCEDAGVYFHEEDAREAQEVKIETKSEDVVTVNMYTIRWNELNHKPDAERVTELAWE